MSGRVRCGGGLWALLLAVALSAPARAGDGVVEIDQACVATGCAAGDAPGFPVTLGAGSFRLTSSLVVADPALDAIQLQAAGATLDLAGFEVVGPVTCTGAGSAVSCGAGAGVGIRALDDRVVVQNGRVRGFGSGGVLLETYSQIHDVVAEANGGHGLSLDGFSIVRGSTASRNGSDGISTSTWALIDGCIASSNGADGIETGAVAVVIDSVANDNGARGIAAGAYLVRGNSVQLNEADGIDSTGSTGSLVVDNAVIGNAGDGVEASSHDLVQGNDLRANTGFGLNATGSAAGWRENTISANTGGTATGGVDLGANSCNAAASCP